jgi:hypothetical protein
MSRPCSDDDGPLPPCPECGSVVPPVETFAEFDDLDVALLQLRCVSCGFYVVASSDDVA